MSALPDGVHRVRGLGLANNPDALIRKRWEQKTAKLGRWVEVRNPYQFLHVLVDGGFLRGGIWVASPASLRVRKEGIGEDARDDLAQTLDTYERQIGRKLRIDDLVIP